MHSCNKNYIYLPLFIIIFLAIFTSIPGYAIHNKATHKRVLIINSYHQGFIWTDTLVKAIKGKLTEELPDVEMFVEYMDAKRINTKASNRDFKKFIEQKYHNLPPDIIITSDDAALTFLLNNRKDLFKETPIVFCGVNNIKLAKSLHGNITGIIETLDIKDNIKLILKLFPDTNEIICVTDSTPTGLATRKDFINDAAYFPDIKFKYFNGENLTMQELIQNLKGLPASSVVIAPAWYKDKAGKNFSNIESYKLISQNSPVPVFVTSAANIGLGVFGGKLNSGKIQGTKAAELAIKILLNPNNTKNYFIDVTSQNAFIFDKQQLLRFKVPESSLPKGSIIINRPFSFYNTYKELVWVVTCAFIILSLTIVLLFLSINKRKKIEKTLRENQAALKESEQRLQLALTGADLGLWDWRIDTGDVFFNEQWAKMLGYTKGELDFKFETWQKLLNPDDKSYVEKCLKLHFDGKTKIYESTHRLLHKDGHWVWVLDRGKVTNRDSLGNPIRACGTHLDITDSKKMQESLKRSEEDLRTTLNSIGDGVIATDINSCITKMNPIAENLTGISIKDALGKPISDVFKIVNATTRKTIDNPVNKVLKTATVVGLSRNVILLSHDSKEYHISDSGAPIINDAGDVCGVVLVFRDVSEEYKIQEQLHQSQKMDAIGQLAGGVAHDFNNMLGGIIGAAEIIQLSTNDDKNISNHLELILRAASRATELCRSLVVFARKNKLEKKVIDLSLVIQDSISLLNHSLDKSIKINFENYAENTIVFGDLTQLQNVFLNLGINSGHAMPKGGELYFILKDIYLDQRYCEISQFDISPGPHIQVEVRDNGCGIPLEHIKHIFEPFYTTRKNGKGTGLGLSTVYGIIKQHSGVITVYSEEKTGTIFNIMLPTSNKVKETTDISHSAISGTGTILVIDDEEILRRTAKSLLESLGYTVLLAENGQRGIEIYKQNQDHINIVLLDMIMPTISGSECFYQLHNINEHLPIIIASGFSHTKDIKKLEEDGLKGFISKPYKRWELSQIIAKHIDS